MNILVDKLPTEYKGLKIDTNFRSFILFELLMQERNISKGEKITLALNLFFHDKILETPEEIKKAIDGILWFYSMGKSEEKEQKKNDDETSRKSQKAIYSFEYDANLIYSAFLSQYGVDLNEIGYLHWWKFKSLFEGLNDDNRICEIMGYRAVDLSQIKDDDKRNYYKKLKLKHALPDNRTEEEKEQDFANALW
jgi:hypothetical protein